MLDSASAYIIARMEAEIEQLRKAVRIIKEMKAMPPPDYVNGVFTNSYRKWVALTPEQRESALLTVEKDMEFHERTMKEHESAFIKEQQSQQKVHPGRSDARRDSRKALAVLHPRRSVARKKGVRRHLHPRRKV